MVTVAGRHAPTVWLCVCTIQVSWARGWNDPVNPELTHFNRALDTVMPTSFGTVLQVGVGSASGAAWVAVSGWVSGRSWAWVSGPAWVLARVSGPRRAERLRQWMRLLGWGPA